MSSKDYKQGVYGYRTAYNPPRDSFKGLFPLGAAFILDKRDNIAVGHGAFMSIDHATIMQDEGMPYESEKIRGFITPQGVAHIEIWINDETNFYGSKEKQIKIANNSRRLKRYASEINPLFFDMETGAEIQENYDIMKKKDFKNLVGFWENNLVENSDTILDNIQPNMLDLQDEVMEAVKNGMSGIKDIHDYILEKHGRKEYGNFVNSQYVAIEKAATRENIQESLDNLVKDGILSISEEVTNTSSEKIEGRLRQFGFQRMSGGAVGSGITLQNPQNGQTFVYQVHPLHGSVMGWKLSDSRGNPIRQGNGFGEFEKAYIKESILKEFGFNLSNGAKMVADRVVRSIAGDPKFMKLRNKKSPVWSWGETANQYLEKLVAAYGYKGGELDEITTYVMDQASKPGFSQMVTASKGSAR